MHLDRALVFSLSMLHLWPALSAVPPNLIVNPGFEGAKTQWAIGDTISSITDERAHGGERSLKIVDPDEKAGSSVSSQPIAVEPGKQYAVWLWTYLEDGHRTGLGAYVNLYDGDGNRLHRASEATCARLPMVKGEWTRHRILVKPPPAAATLRVWLHTFSTSVVTCFVDDLIVWVLDPDHFGPAAHWAGGELSQEVRREWPYGLRWDHGRSTGISLAFAEPQDWSEFTALKLNMRLAEPTESTCVLIIDSENPETEGMDYYLWKLRLDWKGWREFVVPFNEMGAARKPLGWNQIKAIRFSATGWGQTRIATTVATLDGLKAVPAKLSGQRMTDEDLFDALDLDRPGLVKVKAAVARGDLTAAKRAFAEHIRDRETPKWLFDWRDRPFKNTKVPGPEADKAPDQWDYYSTFIKLDWQGWKHFRFEKTDFKGEAFVEGKGWVGKRPIGWHWIQYVMMSASGWGLTPDPQATLYFDDVKLVGKERSVVLSDFEGGECNVAGMELSPARAKLGKASGLWTQLTSNTNVKWTDIPHDWTEFDAIEFWVYSERPSKARIVLVIDSDVPREIRGAQRAMDREWSYTQGPGKRGTIRFEEKIDWTANPTEGEARTHLWNESLNRHFHFRTLARAYWQTGRDEYAKEIADQIEDWVESNPQPLLSSGNRARCYAWQTLTTGIRLADTWPEALYRCMGSPAFSDDVICTILKSVCQQARHLVRWPSKGNWLTAESNGLFTAGMLFPELKEAKEWRAIAIARLYKQLDDEVYPDGMEYELAAGYNNWVVSEFAHIFELTALNNLRDELPDDYQQKMEKMYNYQLFASMPDGRIPGLNDSGNASVRKSLQTGYELFPHRADFLYVASSRTLGRVPDHTSHAFPWSGHYVMRSGWDPGATFLLFDAGPFGFGHQHEDKLHFVLYSHGRQLILDPGNFSYDRSRWRRYVLGTQGHNTITVDGRGQNRRWKRETYFWPRPWQGDAPPDNDAVWTSTKDYDFAAGVYQDGYGRGGELDIEHRRCILWVKPAYFIVVDTLKPTDDGEHTYEALFHLDAADASIDGLAVRSPNDGEANVKIVALPDPATSLITVKGEKDEPVQGWSSGPWRAVPCAIYRKAATGLVRLAFVVAPWGSDQECPVAAVTSADVQGRGLAGAVGLANGETHRFLFADEPGTPVRSGALTCEGWATVEIRGAGGNVERALLVQ